jgi:hypothetical protein
MIVNRASLVGVVFRLAVFYWAVCTLVFVGEDITRVPELLLAYQDVLIEKVWYLAFTALVVFILVLLKIVGVRELRRDMLRGRPALGFTSSLGRVPTPVKVQQSAFRHRSASRSWTSGYNYGCLRREPR